MPSVTLRLLPGKRSFPRFDSGGRPMPGLEPDKEYVIEADTDAALWHKLLPYFNHCEVTEGVIPPQPKPQSASLGRLVKAAIGPAEASEKPSLAEVLHCPHCTTQPFRDAPGLGRHLMRAHADLYPEIDVTAKNAKGQLINDLTPWIALVEGTASADNTPEVTDEAEEVIGDLPAGNPLEDAIVNALLGVEKARQKAVCAEVADATGEAPEAVEAAWEALLEAGKIEAVGRWDYRLANP